MTDEPIVLINAFEVPAAADKAFGRGISPAADFRFVNIANWESEQAFRAATVQPQFRNASVPYPFHASLYRVVRTDSEVRS